MSVMQVSNKFAEAWRVWKFRWLKKKEIKEIKRKLLFGGVNMIAWRYDRKGWDIILFSFWDFYLHIFIYLWFSTLCEKCPKYGVLSGPYFPHSDWMRRDTKYLSVFSPNARKYGPKKTPYLDTFHKVLTI